jgi:cytochrome d ubiquinol oxidase subunit I
MSWCVFLSFPLGFIATLTGWFTAEVGRQPWAVYGILRTADALTPSLTLHQVAISFLIFAVIYSVIAIAGIVYVYQILQAGPDDDLVELDKQHPVLSGASQGAAQSPAETSR